jgi:hypothetical protein
LQYIHGTRDLSLTLCPDESFSLRAFIDAAHGVHVDAKGHSGATIGLGRGSILCKSSKQRLVSKSSTETELIAISDFISIVIMFRNFLLELGYDLGPATMFQDNLSTLKLVERGRPASDRTRHVSVRFFFVKDRVDSKEIKMEYCSTTEMTADILTKPLQGAQFFKLRDQLLNTQGTIVGLKNMC